MNNEHTVVHARMRIGLQTLGVVALVGILALAWPDSRAKATLPAVDFHVICGVILSRNSAEPIPPPPSATGYGKSAKAAIASNEGTRKHANFLHYRPRLQSMSRRNLRPDWFFVAH